MSEWFERLIPIFFWVVNQFLWLTVHYFICSLLVYDVAIGVLFYTFQIANNVKLRSKITNTLTKIDMKKMRS